MRRWNLCFGDNTHDNRWENIYAETKEDAQAQAQRLLPEGTLTPINGVELKYRPTRQTTKAQSHLSPGDMALYVLGYDLVDKGRHYRRYENRFWKQRRVSAITIRKSVHYNNEGHVRKAKVWGVGPREETPCSMTFAEMHAAYLVIQEHWFDEEE